MHQYSPRHSSKSGGWGWLARLWAMPLSMGVAALAGIVIVLAGLAAVTVPGSPSPTSRGTGTTSPSPTSQGTDTTDSPTATSPERNLVADASFDYDVATWRPLPGAFLTRGSAAEPAHHARVQRDPHTPATADPKTGRALYGMVMPVIQSASRGTQVDATMHIRATWSQVPVVFRLSELAGGKTAAKSEVRVLLTDTAWHQVRVHREVGTAGATIQVEVGALALPPGEAVYVDNVRVSSRP